MKKVKIFKLKINDNPTEINLDGESKKIDTAIGMYRISSTEKPAIETKGFYFEDIKERSKKVNALFFEDKMKMRMTTPVLIPDMPLLQNFDGETAFVYFDKEEAEKIYTQFMKNLKTTNIYNIKHTDQMEDAFLFEINIADTEAKLKYFNELFNHEFPINTIFETKQYKNEDSFVKAVAEGRTGSSLEGLFDLILDEEVVIEQKFETQKNNNNNMIKMIIDNKFIGLESLEEGAKASNIEDEKDVLNFVFEKDEVKYEVKNSILSVIKAEKADEVEEDIKEKEEDIKVEEEVKDIEKEEPKKEIVSTDNVSDEEKEEIERLRIMKFLQPELDKLYEALGSIKAQNSMKKEPVEMEKKTIKPSRFENLLNSVKVNYREINK